MLTKILAAFPGPKILRRSFYGLSSFKTYQVVFAQASTLPFYIYTGLWNSASDKIALAGSPDIDPPSHEELAITKRLCTKAVLHANWYGFNLVTEREKVGELAVSPFSRKYGGIPIEYHLQFERSIFLLFSRYFSRILYLQYLFERHLPQELIRRLPPERELVEHPEDDQDLLGPI